MRFNVTTTIPYVNAAPHLGFALELVQADVLARHWRRRGHEVRYQSGTDDNSLKNVLAAQTAGVPTVTLVERNAAAFEALHGPLGLSLDDFIRTGSDPRHLPGVHRLWRACADVGDLYRRHYEGLYCIGCEQFYAAVDLPGGRCPEHGVAPQRVAEENWFFQLSRYQPALRELVSSGRLRIEPAVRRNEVLAFLAGGLQDFSVSRSRSRAHGWGIPVPDDPGQVIYVWWDALSNYLTSLGYGSHAPDYARWWLESGRRVHLVGKGVLRFHAVYWPAILLSAGLPPPTDVLVHDYLTVDGHKIGKSAGNGVDPVALVDDYGRDAVRWWLLREVPRAGDVDFTRERLVARANEELANGLGNLVHRVVSLLHRYRAGRPPEHLAALVAGGAVTAGTGPAFLGAALADVCRQVGALVEEAIEAFDLRRATQAVWRIVDEANRHVERTRPWELARAGTKGELDAVLAVLLHACQVLARELEPFLPDAAARVSAQCRPVDGVLPPPSPLFPRLG
jgi:methionyl-tRNA synthetase